MRTQGLTGAVLGAAAVFGISWIAAIAYWRLGTRIPGPGEIAGLMLGMPATLAGAMAWWRGRAPSVVSPAAPCDSADVVTTRPAHPRFAIRATALELPLGNDLADVLARAADGTGLALHPRLRDPSGFGVLAAEVPGLDTGTVEADLGAFDPGPTSPRPELARALALADRLIEPLLAECEPVPATCGLLIPADWTGPDRELARRWLEGKLCATAPELGRNITVFSVASGQELLRVLRAPFPTRNEAPAGPRLWLALSSNIGTGSIERWARRGALLGSGNPQGRAPGEAAVGIVLDACCDGVDATLLHLPGIAPASETAGDAGLAPLLDEALSQTGTAPGEVHLVVTDCDHHAARCARLAGATSMHLPHLDPIRDVLRLGQACGHADATLLLAAIALCAHATGDSGQASLAVGSDDTGEPALALVAPAATSS